MAKKPQHDPISEAALEVVETERLREVNARNEQADRESRIAECHRAIGRIQAMKVVAKFGNVSELIWIKEVKESQIYKDLPGLETWERFCESIGYTSRHVNDQLLNLSTFGAEFSETVSDLRIGYRDLRKLRQLTHDGAVTIEADFVVIGDERISFSDREDLQAALEQVIETNAKIITDKEATIKAKDKVLKHKSELIEKQARRLGDLEDDAARAGLTADEEAIIRRCDNARVSVDGFLIQFDPERNPLPVDASPRMQAALMETLGYFKRVTGAMYDTAAELYGVPDMDDQGWTPPHLRNVAEELGNSLAAARTKKTTKEG